ncbi:MAG TPA: enoyl-CoA hydratase-related protein [Stellaceae bacterium]|nr:enoyl-CoA hydratase-related protein [Stellaceae bacterium]
MAGTDTILCTVDGRGVAAVTLNRPAVNNAYNGALIDAVIDIFERLGRDPEIRAVVLRGAGRHFQAGADLAFLDSLRTVSAEENREFSRRTVAAFRAVQLCPRPTVALIHGGCFGGGVGFAAACDIAIAAEDAVCGITEVRWGITPAPIIPLLVDRIGARATGRLSLTGERFDAAMAREIGLVHETCPASALDAAGERITEHLLLAGPEAVAITKRLIEESVETPFARAFHDRIIEEAAARRRTPEAAEGLASFREKRNPRWYPERA